MATVTKRQLANIVATDFQDITQKISLKIVDKFFANIADSLIDKKAVTITKLGVFKTKEKKARVARNPKTGVLAEVSARTVVTFSGSDSFYDEIYSSINEKGEYHE